MYFSVFYSRESKYKRESQSPFYLTSEADAKPLNISRYKCMVDSVAKRLSFYLKP
jgi:hypothetical protein